MKLFMTHSENIKNFDDISRHLELEAERMDVTPPSVAYVAKGGPSRSCNKKWGRGGNIGGKNGQQSGKVQRIVAKRQKRTHTTKRDVAKTKCNNCGHKGHLYRDCTEPKKDSGARQHGDQVVGISFHQLVMVAFFSFIPYNFRVI